ncbi:hypothetical protein AB0J52_31895 [Spirillospora sp. NPDC049652]
MTNGARHALGALVGLVASAVLLGWFALVANRFIDWRNSVMLRYITHGAGGKGVVLVLLVLVSGALLAGLCAPRLSPLASLIPGVVLVMVNAFWFVQPLFVMEHIARPLKDRWVIDYLDMLSTGIVLLAGGVLIAMSVLPSRWRGPITDRTGPGMAFSGVPGPGMSGPVPYGQPSAYPPAPPQTPPQSPPHTPPQGDPPPAPPPA